MPSPGCQSHSKTGRRADLLLQCQLQLSPSPGGEKSYWRWAGEPYYQAFLANSGSEANENALKLARAITGRKEVISISGSFHGRSYGSLSATGIHKYANYLNTPVPMHRILPAGSVAEAVSGETAAVLIEPIQSMGGMKEIPLGCLSQIQKQCQQHGAFLIFDEIQTGVARTGSFLYSGLVKIHPEMVTLAKGIASGFPAAALLVTEELAKKVKHGDLGSTFGGGPFVVRHHGSHPGGHRQGRNSSKTLD